MPKKKRFIKPSPAKLKAIFQNSIWYEILYAFGVPKHDPTDYTMWEMINWCRMGHARVLYDFLGRERTTTGVHPDDVLAVDYGYNFQPLFHPETNRARLNKDLFHLSYRRLRHRQHGAKCWKDSILGNLRIPVLRFMKYIRDNRQDLFDDKLEINENNWIALMKLLDSGYELRILATTTPNGITNYQWRKNESRKLKYKRPMLTEQFPVNAQFRLARSVEEVVGAK